MFCSLIHYVACFLIFFDMNKCKQVRKGDFFFRLKEEMERLLNLIGKERVRAGTGGVCGREAGGRCRRAHRKLNNNKKPSLKLWACATKQALL